MKNAPFDAFNPQGLNKSTSLRNLVSGKIDYSKPINEINYSKYENLNPINEELEDKDEDGGEEASIVVKEELENNKILTDSCSICLKPLVDNDTTVISNDKIVITACNHMYHEWCIKNWAKNK